MKKHSYDKFKKEFKQRLDANPSTKGFYDIIDPVQFISHSNSKSYKMRVMCSYDCQGKLFRTAADFDALMLANANNKMLDMVVQKFCLFVKKKLNEHLIDPFTSIKLV